MDKKDTIRQYICTELVPALGQGKSLSDQDELLTGGLVDSLGIVRLVQFIEDEFGLAVPLEDVTLENFGTLELLSHYLDKQAAA